jgi:hypothetical protein
LYAAIRRDARAGVSGRELQRKHGVGWRTVQAAITSAWPQQRAAYPARASKLDAFKPLIDDILRADLDAPRKQRHTVTRIFTPCCARMPTRWVDDLLLRPAADRGGLTQPCPMRVG